MYLKVTYILITILASLPIPKLSAEYEWSNVRIGGGGFVSGIITSKSEQGLIYARTDVGGAYSWNHESKEWIPLLDWVSADQLGYLGVESLATDFSSPQNLYMLVGTSYFNNGRSAILKSDDYGNSFTIVDVTSQFRSHGNDMGRQTGEKLQVDPNNSNILYCGTKHNGIFQSTDAALTWTRLAGLDVTTTPNQNGVSLVVIDPASINNGSSQILYVGISRTGENLYQSTDAGLSFTPITGGPTGLMPHRAVLASDGNLFITYADGAGPHADWRTNDPVESGSIWKYNSSNANWTNVTPTGMTRAFGGISIDPNNPNRILASTINTWMYQNNGHGDRFFLSEDGGTNWTDLVERGTFDLDPNGITWIEGQSIHWAGSIEFDPFNTSEAWVISGNGIYHSSNVDATNNVWKFMVRGLEETVPLGLISIPDGPLISVIGDYDGFQHSYPHSYAPVHSPGMGTSSGVAFAAQNDDVIVRVGSSMYYSTDQGTNWTQTTTLSGTQGWVAISADGSTFLHCPKDSTTTYRSNDRGDSWTPATGVSVNNAKPIADPINTNKFSIYGNGTLYVSTDGGSSFSTTATLPSGGNGRMATGLDSEGDLWIALLANGLRRTTDSGATFTGFPEITYCEAVGLGKAADDSDYYTVFIWATVNGVRGLYRSIDEGATWLRINDDKHEWGGPANGQFVVGDMNVFGKVYMSTAGRGIVYGSEIRDSMSLVTWQNLWFTGEQLQEDSISGPTIDFDQDGLPNIMEWILLTDPTSATLYSEYILNDSLSFPNFSINSQAVLTSITYEVDVSSNLLDWNPALTYFNSIDESTSEDGLIKTTRYEIKNPPFTDNKIFIRLRIND